MKTQDNNKKEELFGESLGNIAGGAKQSNTGNKGIQQNNQNGDNNNDIIQQNNIEGNSGDVNIGSPIVIKPGIGNTNNIIIN